MESLPSFGNLGYVVIDAIEGSFLLTLSVALGTEYLWPLIPKTQEVFLESDKRRFVSVLTINFRR